MEKTGAKSGDIITSVNGKEVKTWDKAQLLLIQKTKDNSYTIGITHEDGTKEELKVTPNVEKDEKGKETKVFGFTVKQEKKYGFVNAIKYAFQKFKSVY